MPTSRGHLNPGAPGVHFDRFELAPELGELVRHVWIVRWNLPPETPSVQRVLGYPTCNIVFGEDAASLAGPDPRLFSKTLNGSGWTVGVLLRPAAGRYLTSTPVRELVSREEPLSFAPVAEVAAAMDSPDAAPAVARVLTAWLEPDVKRLDDRAHLANRVCQVAEDDVTVERSADLAARFALSERSLERLIREFVGVGPKWLIECRRLQAAATTIFADPTTDLSLLAAELGYADYAHFSRRFKKFLATTPGEDRRRAKQDSAAVVPVD